MNLFRSHKKNSRITAKFCIEFFKYFSVSWQKGRSKDFNDMLPVTELELLLAIIYTINFIYVSTVQQWIYSIYIYMYSTVIITNSYFNNSYNSGIDAIWRERNPQ